MKSHKKTDSRAYNRMIWTIFIASLVSVLVLFGALYSYHYVADEPENVEFSADIEAEVDEVKENLNDLLAEEKHDIEQMLERSMKRIDHDIQELKTKIDDNASKKEEKALRNKLAEKRQEKKEFESALQKVQTATAQTWQSIKLELEQWQSEVLNNDQS